MKCAKCSSGAITFIRYNGNHLCREHFCEFFEKRVKRAVRAQCDIGKFERVAVALSGGKDSNVALWMMHSILDKRPKPEIVAITIDEGIMDYRDGSIPFARSICEKLGIEHVVVSFEKVFGRNMDDISKGEVRSCSYCGVFRRHCLNITAREKGADILVTGLNLDDTAQSILMNLSRADMGKLARLGPHTTVQEGLIPRIQPLRDLPEKEVYLYALVNEIKFHDSTCPYSDRAMRGVFKDIVGQLEEGMPGTRHSILRAYDSIRPCIQEKYPQIDMNKCSNCGEPTPEKICKACELKATLSN
jgi:uncharacterized protein (TIGR00269 family)